jgi:uncharacterized protein (UPF0332 family)
MELHEELLQHAKDLARPNATQADLRRAVSATYYALFHLLIFETCTNWNRADSRQKLARMFDHTLMKKVSAKVMDSSRSPFVGEDSAVVGKLRALAGIFVSLQDKRHEADYDTSHRWTFTHAMKEVLAGFRAFALWTDIKGEKIAQEYLVSLLIRPRD